MVMKKKLTQRDSGKVILNLLLNVWSISEGETLFNLQEGMGRFSLAKLKTRP